MLEAALVGYQHQRDEIDAKMAEIRGQIGGTASAAAGKPPKRVLSASARKRIAAAQRKRWRAFKKAGQAKVEAPKRRLSAEGRRRIAEATKKRWAEFRAKKA